jgi:hypothetical protein
MANTNEKNYDSAPEQIVLRGKTSGRELTLKKKLDKNGNVFYKAPLDWRDVEKESKSD